MDAIMDLTARAVSFITLIQDCFLRASVTYNNKELTPGLQDVFGEGFKEKFSHHLKEVKAYEKKSFRSRNMEPDGNLRPVGFEVKLEGLVWLSAKDPDDTDKENTDRYIIELCTGLVEWLTVNNKAIEKNPLRPLLGEDWIEGQIIFIDNFENVIVNITQEQFEQQRKGRRFKIVFKRDEMVERISGSYADVAQGEKLVIFNSAGYMEIAINKGNAAGLFGLKGFTGKDPQVTSMMQNRLFYQTVKVFFE
jgi:hypothetical protein